MEMDQIPHYPRSAAHQNGRTQELHLNGPVVENTASSSSMGKATGLQSKEERRRLQKRKSAQKRRGQEKEDLLKLKERNKSLLAERECCKQQIHKLKANLMYFKSMRDTVNSMKNLQPSLPVSPQSLQQPQPCQGQSEQTLQSCEQTMPTELSPLDITLLDSVCLAMAERSGDGLPLLISQPSGPTSTKGTPQEMSPTVKSPKIPPSIMPPQLPSPSEGNFWNSVVPDLLTIASVSTSASAMTSVTSPGTSTAEGITWDHQFSLDLLPDFVTDHSKVADDGFSKFSWPEDSLGWEPRAPMPTHSPTSSPPLSTHQASTETSHNIPNASLAAPFWTMSVVSSMNDG